MRIAGYLDKENDARLLSDYLHSKGLLNEVEPTQSGTWALWIHEDKHLEDGRRELERFLATPENPIYRENAAKGREFLARRKREDQRFHERTVDVRTSWVGMHQGSVGFLTALLMGVSVIVYLFMRVGENEAIYDLLRIDTGRSGEVLGDVRRGQIWRLFTPVVLHFDILHILFNMLLLKQLGTAIEQHEGTLRFALKVVVFAVLANVGQYFVSGPGFGGMSGVIYGLFGYVWIRGKYDPRRPYELDRNTVIILLIWFFLAFFSGRVANINHTVGLVLGIVWASLVVRRIPFTGIRW